MSLLNLTLPSGLETKVVQVRATESVSAPFSVVVTALSLDPSLPLSTIVGQPASLEIVAGTAFTQGLGARSWSGVVLRAAQVKSVGLGEGELAHSTYRVEIVPRLCLLAQRKNHKIFQHRSLPDIVDDLLAPWKITPTWRIDRARYPKLEFKVQYGESDLHFLTRLLEEAGIAHVFEGDPGSGSRLVLSDRLEASAGRAGSPIPYVDNPGEAAEMEFVTNVAWGREVRPGARALRDHDPRKPALALFGESPKTPGFESRLEQYEYDPGAFLVEGQAGGGTPVADDKGVARHDPSYGAALATRDLLAMRSGARSVTLETNAFDLGPGSVFSIDGHPHAGLPSSARLLVTGTVLSADLQGEWRLGVRAVPADIPYRPARVTSKPIAHGFQPARVVGPAGQEIHTDEFGRVRVQFPWDRIGESDDGSSCWMRVHQGWGGLGYGMILLPRVGQEVLVTFLEGDPDQPVVAGRVYNAVEQVPHKLPAHRTRSTWKSDSTPGGGGFNEIMFEDLAGQELVWQQAEKDRVRLVKNDEVLTIGHDRQILVKNDLEDRTEGFRRSHVGKDADLVVKQAVRDRVEGGVHTHVEGSEKTRIDGKLSVTVLDDRNEKVGGRFALRSGSQTHIVSGENLVGEGKDDVTIRGPGGFLRIDGSGVTIVGAQVLVNVSGSPGAGLGAHPEDPVNAPGYEPDLAATKDPLVQQKTPKASTEVECRIATMVVACAHAGKRKVEIHLPAPPGAKTPSNVLEVVAADKGDPEKITTKITLAKARCAVHKPQALTVKGPAVTMTRAEDTSSVDVFYGERDLHGEVFGLVWPWNERPVDYTFIPGACKSLSAPAVVRVYPNLEPSLSIKFELGGIDDRVEKRIGVAQQRGYVERRGRPAQTEWKLEIKGKVKYGPRAVELGITLEDKFRSLAWLNRLVKRGIDLFCEYFFKFMGVKLLPIFPKVSLTYEGKFKEIDGSWRVGAEWSILFKAEPLLGIKLQVDILEGLIHALGLIPQLSIISKGLLKIKQWAKEKGQTFEILLTISGEIGGEVGAKKPAALPKASAWGAIEGKIKVEIAAKASFGSKGIIGFALGAEVGADTGIAAGLQLGNNEKGVFLKGRFAVLPCKFKVAAWASGKVFWEVKESYEDEYTWWEEQDLSKGQAWYVMGNP